LRSVVAKLRLAHGGAAYTTVRNRMEQLGLGLERSGVEAPDAASGADRGAPWRRSFTDDDLRQAVAAATSLHGVFALLEIRVGGSQWSTVRALILERGWSTAHWHRPLARRRAPSREGAAFRAALRRADLGELARHARNRAELIRELGATPSAARYRELSAVLRQRGITVDHFEPRTAALRRNAGGRVARPLADVLVTGRATNSHTLKLRLIAEGVFVAACVRCGVTEWLGEPAPLQLDHVNGDRLDNRLGNLRLLCPNCHALTDTYAGRNIGRVGGSDAADPGD
jgi:hypothetical protein